MAFQAYNECKLLPYRMKWIYTNLMCCLCIGLTSQTVKLDSSKLPICIIDTRGKTIVNEPKILARMTIIDHGPGKMNRVNDQVFQYKNYIAIELRGNSSQTYPQKQYGIELRDSTTMDDIDAPLMGMPAEEDWVLYAPYNDISMLRNALSYHLWNAMGHWGPRTRFCEVILNNEYIGIYLLTESIKRGPDRVDIAKLKAEDTSGLNVTGGYIMKIDKKNNASDLSFVSKVKSTNNQNITWLYHYPDSNDIRPQQKNYIQQYIDTLEQLIASPAFNHPENGFRKYLSTPSFMDYFILTEFSRNIDAYKASSFFYKEKQVADGSKGMFKAGPVWDYNFAFGNASFCSGAQTTGWMYDGCVPATLPTPILWRRLLQDTQYLNAVKCRYLALRQTILDTAYLVKYLNGYAFDTLDAAQKRHFAKWKILGTNPGGFNAYIATSYNDEMNRLRNWIKNRLIWMDANLGGRCIPPPLIAKMEIPLDPECLIGGRPTMQTLQPFASSPFHYTGQEKINTIPANILRWVLVELRDAADSTRMVDRRAALLRADSAVVDTNLKEGVYFPKASEKKPYFLVVRYDSLSFLASKETVELPNNDDYNLNRNHRVATINASSPIHYETYWTGIDTLELCSGQDLTINDSNLVVQFYGFRGNTIEVLGAKLAHQTDHAVKLSFDTTGWHRVQLYLNCQQHTGIRTHFEVYVHPSPEVVIMGPDSICPGTTDRIWAQAFEKYQWSNGSQDSSIQVDREGRYGLMVTDANGCKGSAFKDLHAFPPILGKAVAEPIPHTNECKYYFVPEAGQSGYRYLWSTGETTDTVQSALANLQVLVTDEHQCTQSYTVVCTIVDNQEAELEEVALHPNPNQGQFQLRYGSAIEHMQLYDVSGKNVALEWHEMEEGIYLVKLLVTKPGVYAGRILGRNQTIAFKVLIY